MDPPSFRSSDYFFAQIASIQFNELFIMNSSFEGGAIRFYRLIRIAAMHQNVLSIKSQFLHF